jgi:hypothetical protein
MAGLQLRACLYFGNTIAGVHFPFLHILSAAHLNLSVAGFRLIHNALSE